MPRRNVAVHKTGDWKKARRIFNGFALKLRRAAERGMQEEADAAVRRIKNNIFAQNYNHTPLSPEWAARKDEAGDDPRTLIQTGGYVRSIDSFRLGKNTWGIGVKDEEEGKKARSHEYGIGNPERPHFRVELERIRVGKLPLIRDAMRRVLRGRWR